MKVAVKNVSFAASLLGNYPIAHAFLAPLGDRYRARVRGDEDLVLEGFARSGNSFFLFALKLWNRNLRVAHHTHLFCNVTQGLRHNIPCVVLIRAPGPAVASMVSWDGLLNSRLALLGWIHFYRQLLPVIEQCLVLRFEDSVTEPEACVAYINERFALSLAALPFCDEQRARIQARMLARDKKTGKFGPNASIPNEEKSERKERVLASIRGSALLQKAEQLYRQVLRYSDAGEPIL